MKLPMSRHAFYSMTGTFTILSILGQVSTSIYSPFFYDLAIMYSSHVGVIEKSVAIFLIAFSISQLLSGFICDYVNKQSFLLYGLLVFMAGTAMVTLADKESTFLIGRIIQGLGGGVGVSVSRGLSRQLFNEKQLNVSLSITNIAFAIAPAIAPLVGTLIGGYFGVSAIFYFVLMMGLMALLLLFSVGSTINQYTSPNSANVLSDTLALIKNSIVNIVSVGIASGLLYGIVFCFITIAPSMVMQQFELSKTMFSIYSLFATLCFVVGSLTNIRLAAIATITKFKLSSIFILGLSLLFCLVTIGTGDAELIAILIYCYIAFFFIGIAMPCSVTMMLGFSKTSAGFLAALTGFFHLTGAAAGAYFVTLFTAGPTLSFSVTTMALSMGSVVICVFIRK